MLGRARVGRDSKRATGQYAPGGFNPRARVGRDIRASLRRPRTSCFNPRARVGRDHVVQVGFELFRVSIHAPAWGATPGRSPQTLKDGMFQSTRPRGARRSLWSWYRRHAHVSIHAPAWGATPAGGRPSESPACFNPRARVGRDSAWRKRTSHVCGFQSTRPRGARPVSSRRMPTVFMFQSTRPRGARPSC